MSPLNVTGNAIYLRDGWGTMALDGLLRRPEALARSLRTCCYAAGTLRMAPADALLRRSRG